jgi:hypothetical protein
MFCLSEAEGAAVNERINYARLLEMADEYDRPLLTLKVLTVDPFGADAEGLFAKGQWFADLYTNLDCKIGIHLRAIHYIIVRKSRSSCGTASRTKTLMSVFWSCVPPAYWRATTTSSPMAL